MANHGWPEGWIYEPADRDVGIFGEGWIHDACPADVEEFSEVEEFEVAHIRLNDHTVRIVTRLVCADCPAEAVVIFDDFDPTEEWWAEDEAFHEAVHHQQEKAEEARRQLLKDEYGTDGGTLRLMRALHEESQAQILPFKRS